jgi:hypothetical protein
MARLLIKSLRGFAGSVWAMGMISPMRINKIQMLITSKSIKMLLKTMIKLLKKRILPQQINELINDCICRYIFSDYCAD